MHRLTSSPSASLTRALMIMSAFMFGGCSFEPTPVEFNPAAATDMPGDRDLSQRTDLGNIPPADMASAPDMSGEEMGQPDMLAADMRAPDMAPEVDMQVPGLGQPCTGDNECASGRCESFGGQGVCTTSCTTSCPDAQRPLVCFEQVCTPAEYCSAQNRGPGCNTCEKCDANASCVDIDVNGQNEVSCVCKQGFAGDGFLCEDVDECATGADNCSQNATCLDRLGGFDCECETGYEGNGVRCDPVADPCQSCDANAACVMLSGQKTCKCAPGYAGNGFTCSDIDECQSGLDDCSINATCANNAGGFMCACKAGYMGDGRTCDDVNECALGTAMCDPIATCTNIVGGVVCTCPSGSTGNGTNCTLPPSCQEIKRVTPNAPDGTYMISTPAGDLDVFCDMTSDGGVGRTLLRLDNAATLGADQQPYVQACAAYGMEIVTPRSQEHMDAIIAWNGSPPNIVNVLPNTNNAAGIQSWQGRCNSQPCSFFINGEEQVMCRSLAGTFSPNDPGRWSDGSYATRCSEYLAVATSGEQSGYYGVDLDGPMGQLQPRLVFCDMTRDGGGWTLAVTSSDDGVGYWTWNNRALWTTDFQGVGSPTQPNLDFKDPAIVHLMAFKDLMFRHMPSGIWASYAGVGDNTTSLAQALSNAPAPYCEQNTPGYAMTAGTLTAGGALCDTDLYFHPGDFDGLRANCLVYSSIGLRDESTFGPAWSTTRQQACPFDDPAFASFGPNYNEPNTEADAFGFGDALNLNTGSNNQGENYIQLYERGAHPITPSGDNTTSERLILSSDDPATIGTSCPYGSWDDRGDVVLKQGWVICALN